MFKSTVEVDVTHLTSMRRRLEKFYNKKGILKKPVNVNAMIILIGELLNELQDTQECLEKHTRE